ncbi:MAG: acetyl-coenzyme A synthetase, partial [Epsilonproteobacteria bacterium]|nr:acetyl-coenzyme A synthetase [Campylobacterota bacterium]
EAAIGHHPNVAECAVVGKPHEVKGESVFAFVVLNHEEKDKEELFKEINEYITKDIGPLAKCDNIVFVPGLPKTRSGKIMRRILRSIAKGEEIKQDTSTLEDPSVVEKIIKQTQNS